MAKRCKWCQSMEFRVSRLRISDYFHFLVLRYPIRCLVCEQRTFAFLPVAWKYRRPKKRPQAA